MNISWIDIVIVVVMLISIGLGLRRGLVKELISLFIWLVAFAASLWFASDLAGIFSRMTDDPNQQAAAAFVVLFFVAIVVGMLMHWLMMSLVSEEGLSSANRILGGVFGGIRGCLFIVVMVFVMGLSGLANEAAWKDAKLLPIFINMSQDVKQAIADRAPENMGDAMRVIDKAKSSVHGKTDKDEQAGR